jgi:hypothetical protein
MYVKYSSIGRHYNLASTSMSTIPFVADDVNKHWQSNKSITIYGATSRRLPSTANSALAGGWRRRRTIRSQFSAFILSLEPTNYNKGLLSLLLLFVSYLRNSSASTISLLLII